MTAALNTTVPDLAPDAVKDLVRLLYGIEGSVQALAGERDQNCLVETVDSHRYVFKISNPSEPPEVVDFQIAALDHIARVSPEQPVPRVVRTLEGGTHGTIALPGGQSTRVRMLTYLDGVQIRETARTAAQRRAMGTGLAGLNRALHGFTIVRGDVHAKFVRQRDAPCLVGLADADFLCRQATSDEPAYQGAAHVAAANECRCDVHGCEF